MFSYRDNLEWLARATNWAKFTATASLGVIHKVIYTYLCEQASEQKQFFGVQEQKNRDFPGSPVLETPGIQVSGQTRELRSHMSCSAVKKKKERNMFTIMH